MKGSPGRAPQREKRSRPFASRLRLGRHQGPPLPVCGTAWRPAGAGGVVHARRSPPCLVPFLRTPLHETIRHALSEGTPMSTMSPQRPLLVIVNGPPASGKSTLGEQIAVELRLPFLSKDAIKEELFDSLGVIERTISRKLGETSMRLMYTVAGSILDAGTGVVIEANFFRGVSEGDLSSLAARADAVIVHCDAPKDTIKERYVERAQEGDRHPVHHDSKNVDDLEEQLQEGTYEPLNLDLPTIHVDTTDDYDPSVAEIVSRLREEVATR